MAEPAALRTTICLDGETDPRLERIGLACQHIMTQAREVINKMRQDVAQLTDDVQLVRVNPPPPTGSKQPPAPTPPGRPFDVTMESVHTMAEGLIKSSGSITAEIRYWAERWKAAKKLALREAWCLIMRIIRFVAEIADRFVGCVAPFWEYIQEKERLIDGFMNTLAATFIPYLEDLVDIWGQWAHNTTRGHIDGCVGPECCALFAPVYIFREKRAVILPQLGVWDY
ncbi:hypothetical protein V8F20_003907 [Naviculisporaceae sp. PSN 640]